MGSPAEPTPLFTLAHPPRTMVAPNPGGQTVQLVRDLDGHLCGGHLFAGTVHVTLELTLWPGQHRLQRGLDQEVGLPLWQLPSS